MKVLNVTTMVRSLERTPKSYNSHPRLHVSIKDETMIKNLENRHSRPYELYRPLLPEILKRAHLDETMKVKWSQRAGCSCGCSPGFILMCDGHFDLYVDISE